MSTGSPGGASGHKRRWRDYQTAAGNRPVRDFLMNLPDDDRAAILTEMEVVRDVGLAAARHIRGDLYEVRAEGNMRIFRVLFAAEGRFSHVLLSLDAFQKTTQRTPPAKIELAERRLADWRRRGEESKSQ